MTAVGLLSNYCVNTVCLANLSFIGFMGQGHLPVGMAKLGFYWLFGPVEREAQVRLAPSAKRE